MNWEHVRHFLSLVEHESLAEASKALGVQRTTVSRRILSLEAETGLSLFDRRGRQWVLTSEGRDLAYALEPMAAIERLAELKAADMKPGMRGRITISAPPALAATMLVAPLVALAKPYPELEIRLVGEMRTASLSRREADIALRLSRPETGDFAISKLGSMKFWLYCHREYLANTAPENWRYVGQGDAADILPQQAILNRIAKGRFAFYADAIDLQLKAIEAGAGIGALPEFVAQRNTDLVPLPDQPTLLEREIWSVTHAEQRHDVRIQTVMQILRQALKEGGL